MQPKRLLRHFQEALEIYNPLTYKDKLQGKVRVHFGTHDRMIPSPRGYELAHALEEESRRRNGLDVCISTYNYGDHSSTALAFARKAKEIFGEFFA